MQGLSEEAKQAVKMEGGGYDQLGCWHVSFSAERQKKYQMYVVDDKKKAEMLDKHMKVMDALTVENSVFVGCEFFPGKLKKENFISFKKYAEFGGDVNIIFRKLVSIF